MKTIKLSQIKIDGGTQPRAEIDESVVSEYAESMKAGAEFPPVVVFHDGTKYWLADGFHRTHAARRIDKKTISAEVHNGTKRDAILYSVGANATHGCRRTNADKHQAVITLLKDDEWSQWSDREIARHCAVTHKFVAPRRKELSGNNTQMAQRKTKRGEQTYTMNTKNIGKNKQAAPDRARQIQHLANEGYRAGQIANELGITESRVKQVAHDNDVELHDKRLKSQRINPRRVIQETVTGLSGYAIGLQTINGELKDISPDDAQEWADSLSASLKPINLLKRKLQEIANG